MKRLSLLFVGVMLFADVLSAKVSIDIHNENIGYSHSPNSIDSDCLAEEVYPSFSDTLYYNSIGNTSVAVNPHDKKHIVAAWGQDRFFYGGSLDIGIARSSDGGKDWEHESIPFQNCNGGFTQRVASQWLSYSRHGDRVYMAAVAVNASTDPNT